MINFYDLKNPNIKFDKIERTGKNIKIVPNTSFQLHSLLIKIIKGYRELKNIYVHVHMGDVFNISFFF